MTIINSPSEIKKGKIYKLEYGAAMYLGICEYINPDADENTIFMTMKILFSNTFISSGERIGFPISTFHREDSIFNEI